MNTSTNENKAPTHIATLGIATLKFHADEYETVIADFVEKNGGGVPKIERLEEERETIVVERPPANALHPALSAVRAGEMNEVGRARSETDLLAARAMGFTPAETVYARGSQVNETGVENATLSRMEWEKRPTMVEAASDFSEKIASEYRLDLQAKGSEIRMSRSAKLVRPDGTQLLVEESAFKSMCERMGLPRAASYLSDCWPELRAINVNN